jgi:hypothetical protein
MFTWAESKFGNLLGLVPVCVDMYEGTDAATGSSMRRSVATVVVYWLKEAMMSKVAELFKSRMLRNSCVFGLLHHFPGALAPSVTPAHACDNPDALFRSCG